MWKTTSGRTGGVLQGLREKTAFFYAGEIGICLLYSGKTVIVSDEKQQQTGICQVLCRSNVSKLWKMDREQQDRCYSANSHVSGTKTHPRIQSGRIIVARHLLVKGKDTHAQKSLDAKGRAENLKDAFEVKYRFDGERVLLVDDIYTTGATVDAAAKVLLQAGADGIYVITAAIGSFS